ncbi:S-methyl-5'-thioadenosine phosphorylase [bacterium]|nr:S-methyl-5'-thioadenosine phosphorylase [bacterium]MCP5461613.1 S-methyl-5'-thioadenosine phosphorylase [bacterium]
MSVKIGVIGGSGLYNIDGIKEVRQRAIETPFGAPSAPYVIGVLEGVELAFLPRHGIGHLFLPSEINYRANIYGFKLLGVEHLVSVSAVGSLKEHIRPMDIVVPDQFVDRTQGMRNATFFGNGIVGHVSFGFPVCPKIAEILCNTAVQLDIPVHKKGTYINIEGPAFSTFAESNLYRSWGMDIIGMTNLTEAKLAREAGIGFATLAMVTDYDCWHDDYGEVSVESVVANLKKNIENAKKIIRYALPRLVNQFDGTPIPSIRNAILTDRHAINTETAEKIKTIIGDYL